MVPVLKRSMQRHIAVTMMLLMMTAALAGCTGSDVTQDDVDQADADGYARGLEAGTPVSTLDEIIARGSMNCGVKTEQWGMGYRADDNSEYQGLDIEYCKAVAAAIGLDPSEDINYVYASGSERFNLLRDGEIDVLIRTTTWTTSRDADLNADFAGVNFFDGQSILVKGESISKADAGNSINGLSGAVICVATGTTTEGNVQDYITTWSGTGPAPTTYVADDATAARAAFTGDECDAYTGDGSAMAAYKWQLENGGIENVDASSWDLWIAPELLSKEPLAAAVRDMDTQWKEVVQWVWFAMVTAEEMGIHSGNYDSADMSDPAVNRLLNSRLGLGTDDNPLVDTWFQNVLSAVGNYGEAYDNSFCDGNYDGHSGSSAMTGCVLPREDTQNALVSEGGLQYAPAMR